MSPLRTSCRWSASPLVAGTLTVLLALALGGCASQRDKYCDTLRGDQARLGAMINSSRSDTLLRGLPLLRTIADQAPDDLTDEWQTLNNAVAGLAAALRSAGVSASAFADGPLPDSVKGRDRRDIAAAADTLSSTNVLDAAQNIEDQAQDVCQVAIGT